MGLGLFRIQAVHMNGLVFGVQRLVGAQARPKLSHFGQSLVVGGAQGRRVGHRVEVVDGPPGAAQALRGHVQHLGNRLPIGGKRLGGASRQGRFGRFQQLSHGGCHLLGTDLIEGGGTLKVQQGIHNSHVRQLREGRGISSRRRGCYAARLFSAACRVLTNNMVMVMGPTPPGTGVM